MGDDEELDGIKEVLPDDVCRCAESSQRMEVGLRHPDAEGCVLLSERLSGRNRRDSLHGFRCRSGINQYIFIIGSLRRRGHIIADEFAKTELKEANKERGY